MRESLLAVLSLFISMAYEISAYTTFERRLCATYGQHMKCSCFLGCRQCKHASHTYNLATCVSYCRDYQYDLVDYPTCRLDPAIIGRTKRSEQDVVINTHKQSEMLAQLGGYAQPQPTTEKHSAVTSQRSNTTVTQQNIIKTAPEQTINKTVPNPNINKILKRQNSNKTSTDAQKKYNDNTTKDTGKHGHIFKALKHILLNVDSVSKL